ncbi:hypothetical protein HPB48_011342 [Haemaphysalis longicornis]|uniref:Uncharacterized protein n=1 Tax=Haemaphysalis longicornis TaxID=44386 RepID=A0A9J6GH65_HAELO|nr:hypothetical protein HPB48_011342 [Haemaphysalis longicornis]
MEVQTNTPKTWHTIRGILNKEGRRVTQLTTYLVFYTSIKEMKPHYCKTCGTSTFRLPPQNQQSHMPVNPTSSCTDRSPKKKCMRLSLISTRDLHEALTVLPIV